MRRRQEFRLRALVRWAYDTVPYYRERMDSAGVRPAGVQGLGDLPAMPVLRREDIRAARAALLSRKTDPRDCLVKATSGTTGMPLRVWRDRQTLAFEDACMWQAMAWAGASPAAPFLFAYPPFDQRGNPRLTWWKRFCGGGLVPLEPLLSQEPGPVLEALERVRPTVIYGYPSLLDLLAQVILAAPRPVQVRPRCIFYHGEQMAETTRDLLLRALGAPIFSRYGSMELSAAVAQTCEQGRWHLNTEGFVVEVVDGHAGEWQGAATAVGHLVITDLRNRVMPLIRYEIGDLALAGDAGPCPCGRTMPVLDGLAGRASEYVVTASGRRVPVMLLFRPMRFHEVRQIEYQFRQQQPGQMEIVLVPSGHYGREDAVGLARHMEAFLTGEMRVTVSTADRIPRDPSGKRPVLRSTLT